MPEWSLITIAIYSVGMFFIFLYSLVQLSLLVRYKRCRTIKHEVEGSQSAAELPLVLVQLPVYNERYVVERLIDAACALDYPKEKLEIQLLDDSSDESFELAKELVALKAREGFRISQVKRPERKGYKAGALEYGLGLSKAGFVAIFDADFVPNSDFLLKTMPGFSSPEIGMVQTRWAHLNRDYSLLTKVQGFALDAHFTIEQTGRNAGGHFINFNGTAGIWRRECIIDAGGWSADTLTEDLDLSYRAQLRGWKFRFFEDVVAPAELPAEMNALKNQQYRWNKGAAECASKHLRQVLTQKNLSLRTRIHAFFHLMNSSIFIWIVVCAVLSLPLLIVKEQNPEFNRWFHIGGILLLSFGILAFYYFASYRAIDKTRSKLGFLWLYPAFLSISMGMSLHNARAVILGYSGKRTPFVRTPKWNIVGSSGTWASKKYIQHKLPMLTWVEGALMLYFIGALGYGLLHGEWGFVPLHLMLIFGFGSVFFLSLKHGLSR